MVVSLPGTFQRGNTAHLKHGVWSDRKVDPLALELAEGLAHERPELARYPATVWAWARAEARCALLEEWFADHRLVTEDGEVAPVTRFLVQFEKLAIQLRSKLGLDPRSEAELATSRAEATASVYDLDALRERGREAMALRDSG